MGKAPAFQWYPNDFDRDMNGSSPSTVGIWVRFLNQMWWTKPRGRLSGDRCYFLKLGQCTDTEFDVFLKEMTVSNNANITQGNDFITVINRRMFREDKEREQGRKRQERYQDKRKDNADITPPPSSPSSSSSSKKETSCPKSKTSDEKTIDMELAEHLFTCILRNNPTAKKPNLQKWAAVIDRMIRLDKRDPDDIGYMIDWCQADEFWRSNILSAAKLREQWDQLYLKSKDDLEEASRERRRDERRRLEGIRSSGGSDRQPSDAGVRGTGEGEAGKKLPQVPGNVAEPGQW